jgi:hypothetical protein
MSNALSRLHSDENAQVSFLAVAAAVCFVALLGMVMNSNDVVRERMRVQEVADVTALSAATWQARGMNIVSMINVLNSKILSMTVLVNSLNKTLPIVVKVATVQENAFRACSGVPFVGPFCAAMAAIVTVQKTIIQAMEKVIKSIAKITACKKAAWTIMEGLQKAAEGVRLSFPAIGTASAVAIASDNGASFGIALNGGLITGSATSALKLPVTSDGYKSSDFCSAMSSGGPGYVMEGYDNDQGPVRLGKKIWDIVFIPFFNLLPHPIFYGFYRFYMSQLGCTPDAQSDDNKSKTQFYDLEACREYNAGATWRLFYSRTDWVNQGGWDTDDFVAWTSLDESGGGDGLSAEEQDKFGDLGKYGEGIPPSIPEPPLSRGPGYEALISESQLAKVGANCIDGNSGSGYPMLNEEGTAAIMGGFCGSMMGGDCYSLRTHDKFTRYSGKTHTKNPSGLDAERTGIYFMRMDREDAQFDDGDGGTVTRYRYEIYVWALSSSGEKELSEEELEKYIDEQTGENSTPGNDNDDSDSQSCRNRVQPLLIDKNDNPENRMRYIAMVYTDIKPPFWSNFFSDPPTRVTAYAQAQVYNKLSEDMFTQDWRARLEHANLLESALSSENGFSLFGGTGGITSEFIGSVNNH